MQMIAGCELERGLSMKGHLGIRIRVPALVHGVHRKVLSKNWSQDTLCYEEMRVEGTKEERYAMEVHLWAYETKAPQSGRDQTQL